jgi:hypothetical protein
VTPEPRRRPLRLERKDDKQLPAGWWAGRYLSGDALPSYVDSETQEPLAGDALNAALASFGVGLKRVTLTGEYRPTHATPTRYSEDVADDEGDEEEESKTLRDSGLAMTPWEASTLIPGTVDASSLASVIYELLRPLAEASMGPGPLRETPKEIFLFTITIAPAAPPPPPPPPPPPRWETIYVDRRTGAIVDRSTWERSRAQLRARAKRTGAPIGTGRYVRTRVRIA